MKLIFNDYFSESSILRGFQAITMSRLNLLPKINISLVSSCFEVRSVKHPWCPLRVTRLLELLKRYSSFHGGAPQSVNNYPQNCQSPHSPTSHLGSISLYLVSTLPDVHYTLLINKQEWKHLSNNIFLGQRLTARKDAYTCNQ